MPGPVGRCCRIAVLLLALWPHGSAEAKSDQRMLEQSCEGASRYKFDFGDDAVVAPMARYFYDYKNGNAESPAQAACRPPFIEVRNLLEFSVHFRLDLLGLPNMDENKSKILVVVSRNRKNWTLEFLESIESDEHDYIVSTESVSDSEGLGVIRKFRKSLGGYDVHYVFSNRQSIADRPHEFVVRCVDLETKSISGRELGQRCMFMVSYGKSLTLRVLFFTAEVEVRDAYSLYRRLIDVFVRAAP